MKGVVLDGAGRRLRGLEARWIMASRESEGGIKGRFVRLCCLRSASGARKSAVPQSQGVHAVANAYTGPTHVRAGG